ncbi:MAG: hypothetical protein ABTQ73_14040 [Caldilineales bacterium]
MVDKFLNNRPETGKKKRRFMKPARRPRGRHPKHHSRPAQIKQQAALSLSMPTAPPF